MSILDPRLWIAAFLVAAGIFFAGWFKGNNHGQAEVRAEWNASKLEANRDARALEQRRQRRADEAFQLANARENRIRSDAVMARRQSDGLRGDLDAVRRNAASSLDAAGVAVATLGNVFESCVREYQDVAEIADRHASDTLTLQQAWPRE